MAGLDKVYLDCRNARTKLHQAMIVAIRSVGGLADEEIAKLLQRQREGAAKAAAE